MSTYGGGSLDPTTVDISSNPSLMIDPAQDPLQATDLNGVGLPNGPIGAGSGSPYDPFAVDSTGGGVLQFPYNDPTSPDGGFQCAPGALDPVTGDTLAQCGTATPGNTPTGTPCLAGPGPLSPGQSYCPGYGNNPMPPNTSGAGGWVQGVGNFLGGVIKGFGIGGSTTATGGRCFNASTGQPVACPAGFAPGSRINPAQLKGQAGGFGLGSGVAWLVVAVVVVIVLARKE